MLLSDRQRKRETYNAGRLHDIACRAADEHTGIRAIDSRLSLT